MQTFTKSFIMSFLMVLLFTVTIYAGGNKENADKNYLSIVVTQSHVLGTYTPLTGNTGQLNHFFEALKETKNKKVRIGHFGDSLLLGDVISEYLRRNMQEKFGGIGAGYMPITANDTRMRVSMVHRFSDDWETAAIITRNADNYPFGVSGSVAIPSTGSEVSYKATDHIPTMKSFKTARLFYSHAGSNSKIEYRFDEGKAEQIELKAGDNVNETELSAGKDAEMLEIEFVGGKKPFMFGVSMESGNGIYLDNFPMPGNSGVSLLEIPDEVLRDFNKMMNYKLIVLNYGANVNTPNPRSFIIYERKMLQVLDKFKKAFPEASFLIVSVADKTVKRGAEFKTDENIPRLLATQKKIAKKADVAFWNLWEAMGGENSMNKWVNAAPPMALKDYAHFTNKGGERVAELLTEAILDAYYDYGGN